MIGHESWAKAGSVALLVIGCQSLPEVPVSSAGDSGSSTGSAPSPTASEGGRDVTGSSGEQPVDPGECVPGLTISSLGGLSDLAGVEIFEGSMTLTQVTDEDLMWFQCLRRIDGDLVIDNTTALTGLDGLARLQSIGGSLVMQGNDVLLEVDGLSSLAEVDSITVLQNPQLQRLDGLGGVAQVERVEISANPELSSVRMPRLTTVQQLVLVDDSKLFALDFDGLVSVESSLTLSELPWLISLNWLPSLEVVGGGLAIADVELLADTDGLSSLREVGGTLSVQDCEDLERLELPQLSQAHTLLVARNPALTQVQLPELSALEQLELSALGSLVDPPELGAPSGLLHLEVDDVPSLTSLSWVGPLPDPAGSVILRDLPQLADVDALAGISQFSGDLWLSNLPSLATLDALSSLTSVEQSLFLVDLPAVSLEPLSSLTSVGTGSGTTWLSIVGLDGLTSLAGLSSLTTVGGRLRVDGNDALGSIEALAGASVTGSIDIVDNDALISLAGLEGLGSLNGHLRIDDNAVLASLAPLAGVGHVAGRLVITNNDALVDLSGLDDVQMIEGDLEVSGNLVLENIDALWPTPVGALVGLDGNLDVRFNPALSQCIVDDFVAALGDLGWAGVSSVEGNLRCVR